ncbi:MAG TPA: alpha-E domain-containing protein [Planctomycetaceae bacterium]|nr:alpha-E domain-containing protein [Planctomycetaceae bacterium]
MLSRVANSVYWMNRYIERAENVARFIDVNLNLTLDLGDSMKEQWGPLVDTTGDRAAFEKKFGQPDRENVWEFLTFDLENPNSIVSCLRSARENARTIREIIPSEMWEELNKAYLIVRGASTAAALEHPHDFLGQVKVSSQLMIGMTDSAMSRGEAWHFAQLGRLLERADKTSRILDVKYFILLPSTSEVGTPLDLIQWSALLKSVSAFQMYHRSRGRITPSQVADFLILDRQFPRAMHFCLIHAEQSLHAITESPRGAGQTPAERQLGLLGSQFDFAYIDDIIEEGLHEFVDRFQTRLNLVDDAVYQTFFASRPLERPAAGQSQSQS